MKNDEPIRFWWGTDFKCLSHVLMKAIVRSGIPAISAIPAEARTLAEENGIPADEVRGIVVHQCPRGDGQHVEYRLHLVAFDRRCWEAEFTVVSSCVVHEDYLLYDRDRDGEMEFLHLLH